MLGHPRCTMKISRYQRVSLVYTCIVRLWLHFSYLWKRKTNFHEAPEKVVETKECIRYHEWLLGHGKWCWWSWFVAFIEIYGGRMESNLTKVRYSSWLFSLRSCWRQINTWLSKGWERLQYLYSFFAIQSKSLQKLLNNLSWCPRVIQTAIVYR